MLTFTQKRSPNSKPDVIYYASLCFGDVVLPILCLVSFLILNIYIRNYSKAFASAFAYLRRFIVSFKANIVVLRQGLFTTFIYSTCAKF